ncbi:MAG: hypothetical protein K2L66_05575, partial [Paramuribaculum sp.]|nr:hypothetical protein [Paramuribaculum sp.]
MRDAIGISPSLLPRETMLPRHTGPRLPSQTIDTWKTPSLTDTSKPSITLTKSISNYQLWKLKSPS